MEKKNRKPLVFIAFLFSVFLIVGGTIAYYTSSDTFNNEFNTSSYVMEVQEAFQSPDDWTPGATTPKEVIATNRGDTVAAVRVKLTPSWVDENGNPLNLTDGTNEAAIINYSFDKDIKWVKEGDWYYYIRPIDKDESTSSIIESVTFNPNVNISATHNCVIDSETHETTCTTETTGYGGGTYTLDIDVQTCQYDKYQEIWNTNVEITKPARIEGTLVKNDNLDANFGYNRYSKGIIEKIVAVDVLNVPDNVIASWDASVEQNGSIMAWLVNDDNDYFYELYIAQEGGVKANPDSNSAFGYYSNVEYIDLRYLDVSEVTNMYLMFYSTGRGRERFNVYLENWDTANSTKYGSMFNYLGTNSQNGKIVFKNMDFSAANINTYEMFKYIAQNSRNMRVIFDNVTFGMSSPGYMFEGILASSYNGKLEMNNVTFINATYLDNIFYNVGSSSNGFTMNISNLSAPLATTAIRSIFIPQNSNSICSITIKDWNTPSLESTEKMFNNACGGAKEANIEIVNLNTTNATDMTEMFMSAGVNSSKLNIKLNNLDTRNVTNMTRMFEGSGGDSSTLEGDFSIYADNITGIFDSAAGYVATINIYSNPTTYDYAFNRAATKPGSGITVNYAGTTTNIDNIIATKAPDSNVVKGSQLD